MEIRLISFVVEILIFYKSIDTARKNARPGKI